MRPILSGLILTIGLPGCGAAEMTFGSDGEGPGSFVDSDEDGLSDDDEIALGTDPQIADSDGDGYSDGAEDNSFTDPLDPSDHPYQGGWPIDSCRYDVEPTDGYQVGDIVKNYTFTDQFGDEVNLHDFCNHVVLIEHAGFG